MHESIRQPKVMDPDGDVLHHYLLPWPGYTGLDQAREILKQFEKNRQDIEWRYFNGSDANAAQMAQACEPTKSACENATNMIDACNMGAATARGDIVVDATGKSVLSPGVAVTLDSPVDAAQRYFGLASDDFCDPTKTDVLGEFAKDHCVVRVFGGYDAGRCLIDFVDAGCGIPASTPAWEQSMLSLNRGFKKKQPIAIGKWGWGAAGCYQSADFSLLASSAPGSNEVMFTLVEHAFMAVEDAAPTFRYLTLKGELPQVRLPSWWNDLMMPGEGRRPSTIVRHFSYDAPLGDKGGKGFVGSVLDRLLPRPVLPIWAEYVHMKAGKKDAFTYEGMRSGGGRLVRGTLNRLTDYWRRKQKGIIVKKGGTDPLEIRHHDRFNVYLGDYDFGGRTGVCPAGRVEVEIFVGEPRPGQSEKDAIKGYVDPERCVLFHLDGQTHHEESSGLVRSPHAGANLAYVGGRCVVGVDCNNLTREAKFVLFGSSREQMKRSDLHKLLVERIVGALRSDLRLRQLDGEIATELRKTMKMPDRDEFAAHLEKYLEKHDLNFATLTRTKRKAVYVEEEQTRDGGRKVPAPIPEELPPRLLRWAVKKSTVTMYPGQTYSWTLETSAPASWWAPNDPLKSHLKVSTGKVHLTDTGSFQAGRIRCQFECPASLKPGTSAYIRAQIDYAPDFDLAPLVADLAVEVVAKPTKPETRTKTKGGVGVGTGTGTGGKRIVKVRVKKDEITEVEVDYLPPVPITFSKNPDIWSRLGWSRDASKPAFTLMVESGECTLYYNAEFRDLIDIRDAALKKHPGTEEKFIKEYEMKLVCEGLFMLNHDTYQDPDTKDAELNRIDKMNRATARVFAMDVRSELDLATLGMRP
jgi:hypothetical protein